jgi:uncharacterized protein (TIGR00369 family)
MDRHQKSWITHIAMPNAENTSAPADFPAAFEISDPIDPLETLTGPFYMRTGGPSGEIYLLAEAKHCNTGGSIHGGLLMTMADMALCAACRDGLDGERAITVSLNSEFLSAGFEGDFIVAKAELTRRGRSMAFARCLITAGDKPILSASAVTKRVPRK